MDLLETLLERVRKQGGIGELRERQNGSQDALTTGTLVARPSANRALILVVNQDATNWAKLRPGAPSIGASSEAGIRLNPQGGFWLGLRERMGEALAGQVSVVADTAQVAVYVYELEAY